MEDVSQGVLPLSGRIPSGNTKFTSAFRPSCQSAVTLSFNSMDLDGNMKFSFVAQCSPLRSCQIELGFKLRRLVARLTDLSFHFPTTLNRIGREGMAS